MRQIRSTLAPHVLFVGIGAHWPLWFSIVRVVGCRAGAAIVRGVSCRRSAAAAVRPCHTAVRVALSAGELRSRGGGMNGVYLSPLVRIRIEGVSDNWVRLPLPNHRCGPSRPTDRGSLVLAPNSPSRPAHPTHRLLVDVIQAVG
jgi:hypothetical protein